MSRWPLRCLLGSMSLAALAAVGGCPLGGGGGAADEGDGTLVDTNGDGVPDTLNRPPFAAFSVSPTQTVSPGQTLTFDASASNDPDNDTLSFAWTQLSGMEAGLSSTTDAVIAVVAPYALENMELRFELTVLDGHGGEAKAESTVFVVTGGEFSGHPQATQAYRDNITHDEAYHLLRRAALGAKPWEVNDAVTRGLTATVDKLLGWEPVPDWVWALQDQYDEDMDKIWLLHLIESPNILNERMAMFWHDRFATSDRVITDYRDGNLGMLHWDMLRRNSLGNYRVFLEELTLDPLMLIWLDGANSPKQNPNENYAREFWELFTLGRDSLYTEQDIQEGARAFTGVTLLRESDVDTRPIYDLLNHDETLKNIFPGRSQPGNYNYRTVIDLTLAQPEAARYVARNLFRLFVHENPSDALVQELADFFVQQGFEIKPLVRRILLSQALFSRDARFNQIGTPVEHAVGVARTLDMHVHSEDSQGYQFDRLTFELRDSGMQLLNPPGVEGWHENEAWLQDQWIISRVRALGLTMEYGPDRTPDLPYHLLPAAETWDQREVRDQIVTAMANVFHLPLSDEEREIYKEVLDQDGWQAFHLGDPRYQPQHVFEMIRLMAMDERVIGR